MKKTINWALEGTKNIAGYFLADLRATDGRATAVIDCLGKGLTESVVMPLDESLVLMETMDTIKAQWGCGIQGKCRKRLAARWRIK